MIRVAKKYNTNLAAIRLTPHLSAQLPVWYHIIAKPKAINTNAAKCLIEKHLTCTVAELIKTATRICSLNPNDPPNHQPTANANHAKLIRKETA
jgi:hypothetical protein